MSPRVDSDRGPLRVLILRLGSYPEDPRLRREVQALVDRGHRVELICASRPGQPRRERVAGAEVLRLPLQHRRAGLTRYAWEYGSFFLASMLILALRLLRDRRRYDIVQVNTLPDFLVWAAWPARLAGVPVLLDFHELSPELFASKYAAGMAHPLPRLLARIETAAARWADGCLAVSEPCLERYVARGAPHERFQVVMNSADPAIFRPRAAEDGEDRLTVASAELAHRAPATLHLVSHGSLVERYGYDLILQALAQLGDLDLRLSIIGEGEARPELEALRDALGLGARLQLTGFVPLDRIPERLADADIGIVANRSDPFTDLVVPTKLMEYIALGIPAVAAETPAVRRYFAAESVRQFPPGDPQALAEAIRAMVGDSAGRSRMAMRARREFESRWGWPRMAARYVDWLEGLTRRA